MNPYRTPRFVQRHVADAAADRAEIVRGLQSRPAQAAPKYFYDKLGSHLFEAITELPEYYPTRTEAAIFAAHGAAMAQHIGAGATLVDLGAGNCEQFRREVSEHHLVAMLGKPERIATWPTAEI